VLGGGISLSAAGSGDDDRRWILLPPACRRCGDADADAESRRHRMRLFCPHWSSNSPAPVELGEAGSEWSEEGCWPLPPWPWSRAGLLVTAAAAVGAEVGAACAGGCGCGCTCGTRGRGLDSSDVVARNAARRELSVATVGGATSSLLDLGAGGAGAAAAAGFLLTPLPMPLGSGRPSELGLGYLQRNQSNGIRVSDWIEQE